MEVYTAASNGDFIRVKRLVEEQGIGTESIDRNGETLLHIASYKGHLDVARYLLERGAKRNTANKGGWTPLHFAAFYGHLEIAMLLLDYGADLNFKNKFGQLPIDCAATKAIKQTIRDEPRRRKDHGHKKAAEKDWHPDAARVAAVYMMVHPTLSLL